MLYIKNNTEDVQKIYVPRNGADFTSAVFKIYSTIDRTEITPFDDYVSVEDGMYQKISFTLTETLDNGEYQYVVKNGASVLATGLMQVGEITHTPKEYNKTIEYEQY